MENQSEKQLREFLEFKNDDGFRIYLQLSPQGDNTTFLKDSINLCTVTVKQREYFFGGISEGFYDKMADKFHYESSY